MLICLCVQEEGFFKVMFSAHEWKRTTKVSKTMGENGENGTFLKVFPLISNEITLRCLRVTIVETENQLVLQIPSVCLLPYLYNMQCACAVLHCRLCPVRLYQIFPHYLINGTIFGRELLNTKCVF